MEEARFILSRWPNLDQVRSFGEAVLPLIRAKEREALLSATPAHIPETS